MPFVIRCPGQWHSAGWKIRVFDYEPRPEPPHAHILLKKTSWRVDLVTLEYLDSDPRPREVPKDVYECVVRNQQALVEAWNERHPHNPVRHDAGGGTE